MQQNQIKIKRNITSHHDVNIRKKVTKYIYHKVVAIAAFINPKNILNRWSKL